MRKVCGTASNQRVSKERKAKDDNVICVICQEKHPANYRGCMIQKQIQQKMYPSLRERLIETRPTATGVTYAQAVQGQT